MTEAIARVADSRAGLAVCWLWRTFLAKDRWIGLVLALISGYLFLHVVAWVGR